MTLVSWRRLCWAGHVGPFLLLCPLIFHRLLLSLVHNVSLDCPFTPFLWEDQSSHRTSRALTWTTTAKCPRALFFQLLQAFPVCAGISQSVHHIQDAAPALLAGLRNLPVSTELLASLTECYSFLCEKITSPLAFSLSIYSLASSTRSCHGDHLKSFTIFLGLAWPQLDYCCLSFSLCFSTFQIK